MATFDDEVLAALTSYGDYSLTLDEAHERIREAIAAALDGLGEVGGIEERAHDVFERSGSIDLTTAEVVELIVDQARRALLGTEGETT